MFQDQEKFSTWPFEVLNAKDCLSTFKDPESLQRGCLKSLKLRLLSYCVKFCLIPNAETQKKWKFRVFGPSKEVVFLKFFYKKIFLVIKLKHSIIET